MTSHQRNQWITLAAIWVAVILFSSTSMAGHWCNQAFDTIAVVCSRLLRLDILSHRLVRFLAEKGVHVCLFLVFAMLVTKVIPGKFRKFPVILLMGAVLGSGSEFLQRFFPGRDPALRDVCINIAGTALGTIISLVLLKPAGSSAAETSASRYRTTGLSSGRAVNNHLGDGVPQIERGSMQVSKSVRPAVPHPVQTIPVVPPEHPLADKPAMARHLSR